MKFEELQVGQTASASVKVTVDMIENFAQISGDVNPIHLDDKAAKESIFGKRIAHGMLIASFISAIIGNEMPGKGAIYLGQNLSFKLPVFIDDVIKTEVLITKMRADKNLIYLDTKCYNQDNKVVIVGDALVKLP